MLNGCTVRCLFHLPRQIPPLDATIGVVFITITVNGTMNDELYDGEHGT